MSEANQAVIERFYNQMWNCWDFAVADEIISPSVRFRGSLGSTLEGLDDFKAYMGQCGQLSPTGTTGSTS
ncbi:MAG TPA: hypothetical protein VFI90_02320 [Rubrobacter sp.]|nr:hypothetical protein [Rubrobacter sp.]